ncbi:unnamed protein product [Amoebophrya sp. A25]|nr:unnamed protein product [Amoebophrya sp. A25]|eukprot:GSA25T00005701001.1
MMTTGGSSGSGYPSVDSYDALVTTRLAAPGVKHATTALVRQNAGACATEAVRTGTSLERQSPRRYERATSSSMGRQRKSRRGSSASAASSRKGSLSGRRFSETSLLADPDVKNASAARIRPTPAPDTARSAATSCWNPDQTESLFGQQDGSRSYKICVRPEPADPYQSHKYISVDPVPQAPTIGFRC